MEKPEKYIIGTITNINSKNYRYVTVSVCKSKMDEQKFRKSKNKKVKKKIKTFFLGNLSKEVNLKRGETIVVKQLKNDDGFYKGRMDPDSETYTKIIRAHLIHMPTRDIYSLEGVSVNFEPKLRDTFLLDQKMFRSATDVSNYKSNDVVEIYVEYNMGDHLVAYKHIENITQNVLKEINQKPR